MSSNAWAEPGLPATTRQAKVATAVKSGKGPLRAVTGDRARNDIARPSEFPGIDASRDVTRRDPSGSTTSSRPRRTKDAIGILELKPPGEGRIGRAAEGPCGREVRMRHRGRRGRRESGERGPGHP